MALIAQAVLEKKKFEIVNDDGQLTDAGPISSPMSLWLRQAKKKLRSCSTVDLRLCFSHNAKNVFSWRDYFDDIRVIHDRKYF